MSEELKAKIKQTWEEAFNQGKVDGLDEIVAPHCVRYKPPFPDIVGREALKNYIADCRISYPDVDVTVDKVPLKETGLLRSGPMRAHKVGCHQPRGHHPPTSTLKLADAPWFVGRVAKALKSGSMEIISTYCNNSASFPSRASVMKVNSPLLISCSFTKNLSALLRLNVKLLAQLINGIENKLS